MTNLLLILAVLVGAVTLILQLLSGRKATAPTLPALETSIQALVSASAERTERTMRDELARTRAETGMVARQGREELAQPLLQMQQVLDGKLTELRGDTVANAGRLRDELQTMMQTFHGLVSRNIEAIGAVQKDRLETLRGVVETRLGALQEDNNKQLEQMRVTVGEKLHTTLEQRLSESFQQVSARLEQVHQGLGEMQSLAAGVGDLRRVFSNVKARGTWGEVQLGALLSQVLTPSQYEENVSPNGTAERVEYVVKMPGQGGPADCVWLPIDAKFPLEDYRRLTEAHDACDRDAEQAARAQLEARIKQCAKDIRSKYICPPRTTNFAVLFLPSESLFAEVVRNGALADYLQQEHRVVLAGPTTLWSILSSLQMGFRTLAIQQRSSDVWNVLGALKTEWAKYDDMLKKVQRKLDETSAAFGDTARRGRAISRVLRHVDDLPEGEAHVAMLLEHAVARAAAPELEPQ